MTDMINKVIHGDCLIEMQNIPDKSIDMILCDLPYWTTACKRDTIIPFEPLREQYKRIIKDNGAIVLTASQPFTSALVMSNPKMFKYEWIWEKTKWSNFMAVKYQPYKIHENILVFSTNTHTYNPVMRKVPNEMIDRRKNVNNPNKHTWVYWEVQVIRKKDTWDRFPLSVQKIKNPANNSLHPTQKPVALFEYLIKTYTNEWDIVLDNCAWSWTTAIACINTKRNYVLIEQEQEYIDVINKRISEHIKPLL